MKRYLSVQIHCLHRKIAEYTLTTARIIFQFVDRYHIENDYAHAVYGSDSPFESARRIQWFVFENWCLVINRYFRKFPQWLRHELLSRSRALLYYTLPDFTWDTILKYMRKIHSSCLPTLIWSFIERGIRGGLGQCSGRYAQANNKYMHSFDPSKSSSYLMYYDVNNL